MRRRVRELCKLHEQPLTIAVEHEQCERLADVTAYRLVLSHRNRSQMRAILLVPDASVQLTPAVLVLPGKHGRIDEVSGLHPPDYPDRNVGLRLARAGFVALVYDHGLSASRSYDDSSDHNAISLLLAGQPPLGAFVEDALALLDWLRSRPGVDRQRVALFGHSMGGAIALHAAVASHEPVCLSVASYIGSFEQMYSSPASANLSAALPGILTFAELDDLFCALPGGALQVQYGAQDALLDNAEAARCADVIRQRYRPSTDHPAQVEAFAAMGHGTNCESVITFLRQSMPDTPPTQQTPRRRVSALRVEFSQASKAVIASEVTDALTNGDLSLSERTAALEVAATSWVTGTPIAVSSGTAALDLIFRDIGVQGRPVLVPANTFFATAAAVERAGGVPVFCDVEPTGLGTDPDVVAAELEARPEVAAVVTIHLGGIISPHIEKLSAITRNAGVPLVEDAAHALGSSRGDRKPGCFGDYAAFSLYATKVATAGEGGFVVVANSATATRIRTLLDHGKDENKKYHIALGGNARISELHAAVGLWSLESLQEATQRRRELIQQYAKALASHDLFHLLEPDKSSTVNGYKCIVILDETLDRDQVKQWMAANRGVMLPSEVYSRPLPTEPYFANALRSGSAGARANGWPVASWFTGQHLCLPIYPSLSTDDAEYAADSFLTAVQTLSHSQ